MATNRKDVERILQHVQEKMDTIIKFLQDMVRIPSETHPPSGDEGPVQEFIVKKLSAMKLDVDVFEPWDIPGIENHPGWWPGLDYHNRPNVVASYHGVGEGRSLILNGHADVVPAGPPELWQHDPYGGEIDQGKLYGRGSVDMKCGIAAMIMALDCLFEEGFKPLGDVCIQSVVNEEMGGYNGTLACCVKGYQADAAIITEPTNFHVSPATKGGQTYKAIIPGRSAHVGAWWLGVSALEKAMRVKEALHSWEELRSEETRNNPYFNDPLLHPKSAWSDMVWYLKAGDPNIMASPDEAEMHFWVDVLPGDDREEVLSRFERYVSNAVSLDPYLRNNPPKLERAIMRPFAGVGIDLDHPIIPTINRATEIVLGTVPSVSGINSACDAMIFNLYSNTPAVVYGCGDLSLAHSPDEYVEVEDVVHMVKALALTIMDFCGYTTR